MYCYGARRDTASYLKKSLTHIKSNNQEMVNACQSVSMSSRKALGNVIFRLIFYQTAIKHSIENNLEFSSDFLKID